MPARTTTGGHPLALLVTVGVAITLIVPLLFLWHYPLLASFSGKLYDAFLAVRGPGQAAAKIVIVDIDDQSLQLHGQWPWPRRKIAAIIEALDQAGAAAIGFDIIFAEPERRSLPYAENEVPEAGDSLLAQAVAESPTVLGHHFHFEATPPSTRQCLLHPLLTVGDSAGKAAARFPLQARQATCNIEPLAAVARRSGFLNTAPDRDGILRQASMIIAHDGRFYPSLGLAVVMQARGLDYVGLRREADGYLLKLANSTVPLSADGRMWLNYRTPGSSFPYISASALLAGTVPADSLAGKIVLVGTTATGMKELRPTPIDHLFPGVEVHATVADNLLVGDILRRPGYALAVEVLAALCCGLLFLLVFARAGAWSSLLLLLAAVTLLLFSSYGLFVYLGLFLSPILPLLVLLTNFSLLNLVKFRQKEIQTRRQVEELALAQASIIESMASLTESRHRETGQHIMRTQEYVRLLARLLQDDQVHGRYISDELVDLLHKTAPLHDIGKVGVPDRILLKPGRLTAEEFEEIKKHPLIGRDIVTAIGKKMGSHPFLLVARDLIATHHEKWNGSGYPYGLKGEEIPLAGRIMAVVDMYDALTSKRVYKDTFSHEEAIAIMEKHSDTSFDPRIFAVFLRNQELFRRTAARLGDLTGLPEEEAATAEA